MAWIIKKLRWWLLAQLLNLPAKIIEDRRDSAPYLIRYRLMRCRWFAVHVHHVLRPDYESRFHDHPWPFFHVILAGGYLEANDTGRHFRRPGFMAVRKARYRHAIDDLPTGPDGLYQESWSLVVRGPRQRAWGFHCRGGWIHHADYHERATDRSFDC